MLPEDFDAVTLTPGAYLKYRRTAAGLGIEDVAQVIATVPDVPEHRRGEWLKLIEADGAPASWPTIVALRQCFAFDLGVLEQLSLIALGENVSPPTLCHDCAEGNAACLALGAAMSPGPIIQCLECASLAAANAR